MTIAELIEKLKEYPQDTRVVVRGYEGGVNDVEYLEDTYISLNKNTVWCYGKHDITDNIEEGVPAIELCGG